MFFFDSPHLVVLQKPASSDENPIGSSPFSHCARLDLSWGSSAFQTSGFGLQLRPWSNLKEMGTMDNNGRYAGQELGKSLQTGQGLLTIVHDHLEFLECVSENTQFGGE